MFKNDKHNSKCGIVVLHYLDFLQLHSSAVDIIFSVTETGAIGRALIERSGKTLIENVPIETIVKVVGSEPFSGTVNNRLYITKEQVTHLKKLLGIEEVSKPKQCFLRKLFKLLLGKITHY